MRQPTSALLHQKQVRAKTINFQVGVQAGGPRFRKNSVPING